jgi:hypothetical protein
MDIFVGDLIKSLEAYDEDVVLVLYGDHLPSLDIKEKELKNGDLYETQYIVWSNFGLDMPDKDIELFADSHKEEITEYAAITEISDDFILSKIPTMKELEEFEPTLLYKMLQITKGESNAYWYDNGSGLDTICIEVMDNNRDKTYLFVFGADRYNFSKILSVINDVTSDEFKPHTCLKDIFVFDNEED